MSQPHRAHRLRGQRPLRVTTSTTSAARKAATRTTPRCSNRPA